MPKLALDVDRCVYPGKSSGHQYQAKAKNLALYANEEQDGTAVGGHHRAGR
jgi:hypothetical protein